MIVDDLDETGNPAETAARCGSSPADRATRWTRPRTSWRPPRSPADDGADRGRRKGHGGAAAHRSNAGDRSDRLRVRGPSSAAGERIRVHVRTAGGHWRVLRRLRLDDTGDASVTVRDRNGNRVTRYRVRLLPNPRLFAFTSKVLRRR